MNFGVEIDLGPLDLPSDADFGLLNLSGHNYFRWSVGPIVGWKTGILAREWCDEITNSVNVDFGGGVAELGGCVVRVVNGTKIANALRDTPVYGAKLTIYELPSTRIFQGSVSYIEWSGLDANLHVESLDSTADVDLSGIVDGVSIPVQFGVLDYAKGVIIEDGEAILEVPGLSHRGANFPALFIGPLDSVVKTFSLIADTAPTDWAAAQAYINALIPTGLVLKLFGSYRLVVSATYDFDGLYYLINVVLDAEVSPPAGTLEFTQRTSSFVSYSKKYAFDTWPLEFKDRITLFQNGIEFGIGRDGFIEDQGKLSLIPNAAFADEPKIIALDYKVSVGTVFQQPSIVGNKSSLDAVNPVTFSPTTLTDSRISNRSVSTDLFLGYIGGTPSDNVQVFAFGDADVNILGIASGVSNFYAKNAAVVFDDAEIPPYIITSEDKSTIGSTSITVWPPVRAKIDGEFGKCVSTISINLYNTRSTDELNQFRAIGSKDAYLAMDLQLFRAGPVVDRPFHIIAIGYDWFGDRTTLVDMSTSLIDPAVSNVYGVRNCPQEFGGGNSPYSYAETQGVNGWLRTKIPVKANKLEGIDRIEVFIVLPSGEDSYLLTVRELGICGVDEIEVPDAIYARLNGRADGSLAKTLYSSTMQTPLQIARHIRQLMRRIGATPPTAGIGQDFYTPLPVTRGGAGGYTDPDIIDWMSGNNAAATFEDAGALNLLGSLFQENFAINWRDNNGLDGVAQIIRAYNSPITKKFELDHVLPGSISVAERDASLIYCAPFIRWGKLPNGEYQGSISITGVEFNLATEALQAARVVGSSLDQAGRALLWRRARALYLKYGNIAPLPDDIAYLDWCKSAETAEWYLDNLLSWFGVNASEVVSPRRTYRFSLPYEDADDNDGRKIDVGSRFVLNLPHETDGLDYECVCISVTHDLVGLISSVEALGFIATDWPTPVDPADFVQDEFSTVDIWEDEFTFIDEVQDIWA